MDDTENNVIPGYSPATFSSEGFVSEASPESIVPEEGQTIEADYTELPLSNRRERKKRNPSNRRVEELIYERGNLEQQNTFLVQQALERDALLAEQNKRLQAYEAALAQGEAQNSQYFEDSLDNIQSKILQGLKRAKEDGDVDEEIKLTDELADIKAKKNTHQYAQYQKYEQQQQRLNQISEEPYIPIETYLPQTPQRVEPVNEEFQEWVEDNPWYANSPRLKDEADLLAQDLADRLTFNNQSQMIGTPQFRESITNIMRSRYGIESNSAQTDNNDNNDNNYHQSENDYYQSEYLPMTSNNYSNLQNSVAPVTRRGINTMADQYVQNRQRGNQSPMRPLTKEEYAIARYLPIKKGEGEADLVRRYAEKKNYPKSPLEGGTPHRLTIL